MEFLNAIKNNDIGFIEKELAAKVIRINDTVKDKRGKHVTTPLVKACEVENIEIVELLIKHNADVNRTSQSTDGSTPLYIVSKAGNYDLVELLVECGARVNQPIRQNKSAPLHTAIEQGHLDIIKYLLSKGADVDMLTNQGTPLIVAVEQSNMQLTKLLLANGANVNGVSKTNETAIHKSVERQYISMIELLHEHGANIDIKHHGKFTLLHTALRHQKNDSLKYILMKTNGRDINIAADGKTPLAWAAENENVVAMKLLLSYKAKVNLLPARVDDNSQENAMTALMCACWKSHRRPIELLIDQGAKVNQQNRAGDTALHILLYNNNVDIAKKTKICELLLKRGAIPTLKNNWGVSPFYYAVRKGFLPLIEIFLNHGANPNMQDELGENALHRCVHFGVRYLELLFKYRVDINKANVDGNTPLHLAVMMNLPTDHVQMLITNGARVARNHNGEYPIHFATTFEMIIAFARTQVSVNETDHHGNTTLHRIAQNGIEKSLLKQCINSQLFDLELKNDDGKTVFDIVMEHPTFELMKLVESYKKKQQKNILLNTSQNKNLQGSMVKEDTIVIGTNKKVLKPINKKKLSKTSSEVSQEERRDDENPVKNKPPNVKKTQTMEKRLKSSSPSSINVSKSPDTIGDNESPYKANGRDEHGSFEDKEQDFSIDMEGIISSEDEFFRDEQIEAMERNRYCSFYESSTSDEGEILYQQEDEEPLHNSEGEEQIKDHHEVISQVIEEEEEDSTAVVINIPVTETANQCNTTDSKQNPSPLVPTEKKADGEAEDWDSAVVDSNALETQFTEKVGITEKRKPDETTEGKPDEATEGKPDETTEEKPDKTTEGKPDETTEEKPDETTEEKHGQSDNDAGVKLAENNTLSKETELGTATAPTENKKSGKSQIPTKVKRAKMNNVAATTTNETKTATTETTKAKSNIKTNRFTANKTTPVRKPKNKTKSTITPKLPKAATSAIITTTAAAKDTTVDGKKKIQQKTQKKSSSKSNDKTTALQSTMKADDKKNNAKRCQTKPTVVIFNEYTSFDKAVQISEFLNRKGKINTIVYPDEHNKQPDTSKLQEVLRNVKTCVLCLTRDFVDVDNENSDVILRNIDRSHKPVVIVRLDVGHAVHYEKSSTLDLLTNNEHRQFELCQTSFEEELSNLLLHIKEQLNLSK